MDLLKAMEEQKRQIKEQEDINIIEANIDFEAFHNWEKNIGKPFYSSLYYDITFTGRAIVAFIFAAIFIVLFSSTFVEMGLCLATLVFVLVSMQIMANKKLYEKTKLSRYVRYFSFRHLAFDEPYLNEPLFMPFGYMCYNAEETNARILRVLDIEIKAKHYKGKGLRS